MNKSFLRLVSILVTIAFLVVATTICAHAEGGQYLGGPPLHQVPLEVSIGFSLVNITNMSERDETIDFEGAIYLIWNDPHQAYNPTKVGLEPGGFTPGDYSRAPRRIYQGDFAVKELFQGWRPHIVIPNGIGDRSTTKMTIGIWPDGRVEYTETFYAKVETPMDLRLYPFDSQSLEIFFHPNVKHSLANYRLTIKSSLKEAHI